jgi:hypothetical protein
LTINRLVKMPAIFSYFHSGFVVGYLQEPRTKF